MIIEICFKLSSWLLPIRGYKMFWQEERTGKQFQDLSEKEQKQAV